MMDEKAALDPQTEAMLNKLDEATTGDVEPDEADEEN